jgi:hypothetical protein
MKKKLQVIRIGKQNTKLDFMSSQTIILFSPAMYWERAPDGNEKDHTQKNEENQANESSRSAPTLSPSSMEEKFMKCDGR